MTIAERTQRMEAILSEIIGHEVEITIRGERSFTVSTVKVAKDLGEKVSEYFGKLATVKTEHDEECGSFSYVDVA